MRVFVRGSLLAVLIISSAAHATDGLNLPAAPRGSGGEDTIQTAEGTSCRQSMNSNGAYLDMGATARKASPLPDYSGGPYFYYPRDRDSEGIAYVRITIPLGAKPARIDCSRLYELEIARLQRELELMRMAAE